MPQRYLPQTDKKGASIEYVWVDYRLQQFQEKRYYLLYPGKKYYQNYISITEKLGYRLRKLKRFLSRFIKKYTKRNKVEKVIKKAEITTQVSSSKKTLSKPKVKEKTSFEPKRNKVKMTGVVDDKSLSALMALKDELSEK